jgi:hypothetical protein
MIECFNSFLHRYTTNEHYLNFNKSSFILISQAPQLLNAENCTAVKLDVLILEAAMEILRASLFKFLLA